MTSPISVLALAVSLLALGMSGFLLYRYVRMRMAVGKFTRTVLDVFSRGFHEQSAAKTPAARAAMREGIQCVQQNMDKAVFYDRRTGKTIAPLDIPNLLDDLEAGNLRVRFDPKCASALDANQRAILADLNVIGNDILSAFGALAAKS